MTKNLIFKEQLELECFAQECEKELFNNGNIEIFEFPQGSFSKHDLEAEIKKSNEKWLSGLIHNGNVYAIFVRDRKADSRWIRMYVGHSKSKLLRQRVTAHLVLKNENTGSVLENIKTAVLANKQVGISIIKITPEPLRHFIEEAIISRNKPQYLAWNKNN